MESLHIPVLLEEVRHWMRPVVGGVIVDGTLGLGGHSEMLLEESREGIVIGIDRDARNIATAKRRLERFGSRFIAVHGNYSDLIRILDEHNILSIDGILLDLGFSSVHIDEAERGFSFIQEGPLDMRYDSDQGITAADVVNSWPEARLVEIFIRYGEEREARRIAQAIVAARKERKFSRTTELSGLIEAKLGRRGKIHPATRVFQALRIVVNGELEALVKVLPDAVSRLNADGRLCVISFHSLEDRIVKRFFRSEGALDVLTKKPLVPTDDEISRNPRSRSSKMRVAQKNKYKKELLTNEIKEE